MVYTPIAKLEKFMGKEDNAQPSQPMDRMIPELCKPFHIFFRIPLTCDIKVWQEETKAVTTYLECFHRNLHQIQAIQVDYFTVPQILNQFIRGLYSTTIINARDFEAAKFEANHVQKLERYLADNRAIYHHDSKRYVVATIVVNKVTSELAAKSLSTTLHSNSTTTNLPNPSLLNPSISYLPATAAITVTNDELLAAIFLFEIEGPTEIPFFSRAAFDTKLITAMYTDVKIDGQAIKLILDIDHTINTKIINANRATKTPIGKIDNFLIKINDIIVPIKKLQLSQNGQYTKVPVTCGHFKTIITAPLIEFEKEKKKPTWKAYQVSWTDTNHNELLSILLQEKVVLHGSLGCAQQRLLDANHVTEEPISSCTSESDSIFNPDSNSKNDNNNDFSSIQNGNNDNNDNLNSDSDSKQYIALFDLFKEQKLRWFSYNNESIMPEHTHDTNIRFDLRYLEKDVIKLEPHLCICIDLKVALEISAKPMVQLTFKSSLVKKGINIRGGIIDTGYVENIIVMLQNDSEKAYIIEPNKKIAQAIFLFLVKVA
ncbi:hypothetical protein G9A89_002534 [Geosiphon pyriformis]|nr:hypothetical protein G9A89_002534 [Geosiphon pyriformis]